MSRRAAHPAMLALVVAALAVLSLHVGLRLYSPATVWAALAGGEGTDALVIASLRVPRTLLAMLVGAALGVAGLLMQTATRNDLAEPGLLGVNAGAALAVVVGVTVLGSLPLPAIALLACAGALAAVAVVFGLGAMAGPGFGPVHLLLAGVTTSALLVSATQVLVIVNEATMEELLYWLAGGFADRDAAPGLLAAPLVLLVVLAALSGASTLDALRADDATAEGLGVPVRAMRRLALAGAGMLAGLCVAVAGPVAFVGLVAPHLARLGGGRGHAELIPAVALIGMALALAADILARFVIYPSQAPVGAVTAVIGAPVLVMLLRANRLGATA